MSQILDPCAIRSGIDDAAVIPTLVATKQERPTALIAYCRDYGCRAAAPSWNMPKPIGLPP